MSKKPREVLVELPEPGGMHRMDITEVGNPDGVIVWEERRPNQYTRLTSAEVRAAQRPSRHVRPA